MAQNLSNKYFVKRTAGGSWEDVTTKFAGIKILSIDGMNELGDAQNVYTAQWVNSQVEDYHLTGGSVIRTNVDISVTFVAGQRYGAANTQSAHDAFVNYMCNQGDLYIKSTYTGKYAHVVCIKGYKPTTQKLHRGSNSYILGTITLHTLDKPSNS